MQINITCDSFGTDCEDTAVDTAVKMPATKRPLVEKRQPPTILVTVDYFECCVIWCGTSVHKPTVIEAADLKNLYCGFQWAPTLSCTISLCLKQAEIVMWCSRLVE